MKNLARLVLFFSISFAVIFLLASGFRFLALQAAGESNLPQKPETVLTLIIAAAGWALPLTLFSSILVCLSYAARRQFSALMTVLCIIVLAMSFTFGISFALYNWKQVPPAGTSARQLGGGGLILSNSLDKNETAVVLLNGTAEPLGPRVTAIPGRPLNFQTSTANADVKLPPIPFGNDTPWFLKSLSIDIRLCGEEFERRFGEGLDSFFIYTGALIFLLSSLGFIIKFSVWPFANLCLGALAFRGIFAAKTFFNSPEMREIFGSFFDRLLPPYMVNLLVVPAIFFGFGLLVNIYALLVYAAKRRDLDEE